MPLLSPHVVMRAHHISFRAGGPRVTIATSVNPNVLGCSCPGRRGRVVRARQGRIAGRVTASAAVTGSPSRRVASILFASELVAPAPASAGSPPSRAETWRPPLPCRFPCPRRCPHSVSAPRQSCFICIETNRHRIGGAEPETMSCLHRPLFPRLPRLSPGRQARCSASWAR